MTKEVKTLDKQEVDALVKAYVKYKAAEAEFKALKETLTNDIEPGKHVGKYGYVNKSVSTRTTVDYKKLLEDNPDIDISKYTTEKEVVMVTIQNLLTEDDEKGLLRHLF